MGSGGIPPPFLISALDGSEWSASHPGSFTPWEQPPAPTGKEDRWTRKPVWTMWNREKISLPCRESNPDVRLVARRYSDWAIPVLAIPLVGRMSTEVQAAMFKSHLIETVVGIISFNKQFGGRYLPCVTSWKIERIRFYNWGDENQSFPLSCIPVARSSRGRA
jgi:hypothetical protein